MSRSRGRSDALWKKVTFIIAGFVLHLYVAPVWAIEEVVIANSTNDPTDVYSVLEEETPRVIEDLSVRLVNGVLKDKYGDMGRGNATNSPRDITAMKTLADKIIDAFQEEGNEDLINDSSLAWLQNIYNPHGWNSTPPGNLRGDCRSSLEQYLHMLLNGTVWAAKMTDASGRYSSQFFFGNDFWLGSSGLCTELQDPNTNSQTPPFEVSFSVARMQVSIRDVTTRPRTVFLGLCLPRVCSPLDITRLLQATSPPQGPRSLMVLRVRPVPGEYRLMKDIKFHILAGVSAALFLLMAAGTGYELLLERRSPLDGGEATDAGQAEQRSGCGEKGLKTNREDSHTGVSSQLLLSFSALTNGRKILQASTSEDALSCVHGLRFLSLAWVILVHTYLEVFAIAENKTLRTVTERNFMFQTISNATFSVDTFFFISGLLLTFLYFRSEEGKQDKPKKTSLQSGTMKFATLVMYRFIRLTPAYLFVLGMVELSMRWIHNNSVFEPNIFDQINCDNYWWRNALYINSLFPRKDMCMLWSWYMANDTQFYVLGLVMLLLASRYFRFVVASWGLFLISSWCTTAFISVHFKYQARVQAPFALFDELYDKPWMRVGPYLVGMAAGWLLHLQKGRIQMPPVAIVSGWILSLGCLISLVYGLLHVQLGVLTSAVYVSLGHTAWGLALAWIVVACCSGYGGFVNSVLSFRALVPLSRLTYCAYLVHPCIMVLTSFQMDGPLHLHNGLVVILYLGNIVASYLLSFIISLVLEAPLVRLLKLAMTGGGKKNK